jgi:hypothetical protein
MENNKQLANIGFKCRCGYNRFGSVMDDPSCVLDTAKSVLIEQIKNHRVYEPGCGTYDAWVVPGWVTE